VSEPPRCREAETAPALAHDDDANDERGDRVRPSQPQRLGRGKAGQADDREDGGNRGEDAVGTGRSGCEAWHPDRRGLPGWVEGVHPGQVRFLGMLEVLGAICLVVPAVTGIAPAWFLFTNQAATQLIGPGTARS
jgi:hypothetical protein